MDPVSKAGAQRAGAEQVRGQIATLEQGDRLDQHIRAFVLAESSRECQTWSPEAVAWCCAESRDGRACGPDDLGSHSGVDGELAGCRTHGVEPVDPAGGGLQR